MNIKLKVYIIMLVLCSTRHSLSPMIQRGTASLQEQAFNQLSDLHNLRETVRILSNLPEFCPDLLVGTNDFVLRNNLAFCRVITLNFLASTQHHVSMLPELSASEMQSIQPGFCQKTLCKNYKFFTANTDGVLSSLDLLTKDKITKRLLNRAFSCINANSEILVTSQVNSNIIQLWNISDLTEVGSISTQVPTAHLEIINNLLVVLNTAGEVDIYSWPFGNKLCHLQTGIQGIIVNISWNKISRMMFVSTTRGRYIISLGDMIMADQLLHDLGINQLILFAYILQNSKEIVPETLELNETFKSFPSTIKSMIQYLFGLTQTSSDFT
ncbi:MAG: hypothetical protein V1646_00140 [bacterium]